MDTSALPDVSPGPLPSLGPESAPAVESIAARDAAHFFALLLKGIKSINLYRHAEERFTEFISPAHTALARFLHKYKSLPLRLSPYMLQYKGSPVYHEKSKENLTYKLYRDGMRYVVFRTGISRGELLRFSILSSGTYSERELLREDMVTRFWKEDFDCIDQIVVDGFGFGELSDDEVQLEVEKIIGYLRAQLSSKSQDTTRFARFSLQDLILELTEVEQIRGGIVTGRPASPQDRARIQDELLGEEQNSILSKVVTIVFQVLEVEAEEKDYSMLMEVLVQLLDLYLVSDDLCGVIHLSKCFAFLADKPLPFERRQSIKHMHSEFLSRMVEPQRLSQIGQYLQLSRDIDVHATKSYLLFCRENEIDILLDMLVQNERKEAKRVIIDTLVRVGKDKIDVFAARLGDPSSVVVRDMLTIIFEINPPNKLALVSQCYSHPSVMIRLEALKAMTLDHSRESLQYIQKAFNDENTQIRMGALRALSKRSPVVASQQFILIMKGSRFFGREVRERNAVVVALGETRTPEALEYLSGLFSPKASLFNRSRQNELKMLAVIGLQAMRTLEAFHAVNGQIQNRSHSIEVLKACQRAAHRIKDYLEKEHNCG
ncbi:MAG: HEAT repeat domain-containing protein [Myxococcales bacterium]|nr:HEAT repeat domain-containing protein [Myxococcales bacterium]